MRSVADALDGTGWTLFVDAKRVCVTDGARYYLASKGASAANVRVELEAALSQRRFPWLIKYPTWNNPTDDGGK